MLDLSKIEAQKMDVHAIEFTLGTLLAELEAATGSLIAKNNNTLSLSADAPDTVLMTDDLKVKQILLNLIGNAAKFTTDGQISVHAAQIEQDGAPHIRFTVKDTGIGMSQEQLANLFQRFAQADATTTRKYGGTGLGLALTRALSTMLGGRIDVESAEGEGTTFTVTVPCLLYTSERLTVFWLSSALWLREAGYRLSRSERWRVLGAGQAGWRVRPSARAGRG